MNLKALTLASIASVATIGTMLLLGAPARATVQDILISNGEDGCDAGDRQEEGSYCEQLFSLIESADILISNGEDGCDAGDRQEEGSYCEQLFSRVGSSLSLDNGQLVII